MTKTAALTSAALDALRSTLRGQLLTPDSAEYDAARAVWNGMIDTRPALIVRCSGAADAIGAVGFARENGLRTYGPI